MVPASLPVACMRDFPTITKRHTMICEVSGDIEMLRELKHGPTFALTRQRVVPINVFGRTDTKSEHGTAFFGLKRFVGGIKDEFKRGVNREEMKQSQETTNERFDAVLKGLDHYRNTHDKDLDLL
jgi:hypothetical protein